MVDKREEFFEFSLRMSKQHAEWFAKRPLDADQHARFEAEARRSIEQQKEIEANDKIPFAEFMKNYFAQS